MTTILVVDDHPPNRRYLTTLLGYAGHRTMEAADGAEALEMVRRDKPDLIITDILMPTMDGPELVRRLRGEPGFADVPVVFWSASYLESEARGLAEACGVRHILTKPAEPERVLSMVREVLGLAAVPGPPLEEGPQPPPEGPLATHGPDVVPRLNAIIDLSLQVASERDPSRLLETFCAGARRILGARYAVVGLVRTSREEERRFYASGLDPEVLAGLPTVWRPAGLVEDVLTSRRPLRATASGPERVGLPAGLPPASSFLIAPLQSPTRTYGWLCVADRLGGDGFPDEEVQLAALLAGHAGRTYETGSLYQDVRQHAQALECEIAERRRAEAALRESEERFRQLAENIPEVFWLSQIEPRRLLYVSPAYEQTWGRPPAELFVDPLAWTNPVIPEDKDRVMAAVDGLRQGRPMDVEFRIRRPDGSLRWIWTRGSAIVGSDGLVDRVMGVGADITDKKELDGRLRQAHKMEALGRLAGGVAHDFNNLLSVILGHSERAFRALPPEHPERPRIEQVLRAAERAAAVTRQLLTLGRKEVVSPRLVDVRAVVEEVHRLLGAVLGEGVSLQVTVLGDTLAPIRADPGSVERVLTNLIVNARDAMPNGGRLTIEMANAEIDADYAHGIPAGRYVRLSVIDTGTGIPPEVVSHIFEPFFTTKERGKGTGLGLSTVYAIVQQTGGHIEVQSEPGQGTTFRLLFPAADHAGLEAAVGDAPTAGGTETLLLVEDEPDLRGVVREMLEGEGYSVLEAAGGEAALRLAREYAGGIDLLVTDVIMPGMNGAEVAAAVAAIRPGVKVLFISGYTDDTIARQGVLPADVALLHKPFTVTALAGTVREVLDGRPPYSARRLGGTEIA